MSTRLPIEVSMINVCSDYDSLYNTAVDVVNSTLPTILEKIYNGISNKHDEELKKDAISSIEKVPFTQLYYNIHEEINSLLDLFSDYNYNSRTSEYRKNEDSIHEEFSEDEKLYVGKGEAISGIRIALLPRPTDDLSFAFLPRIEIRTLYNYQLNNLMVNYESVIGKYTSYINNSTIPYHTDIVGNLNIENNPFYATKPIFNANVPGNSNKAPLNSMHMLSYNNHPGSPVIMFIDLDTLVKFICLDYYVALEGLSEDERNSLINLINELRTGNLICPGLTALSSEDNYHDMIDNVYSSFLFCYQLLENVNNNIYPPELIHKYDELISSIERKLLEIRLYHSKILKKSIVLTTGAWHGSNIGKELGQDLLANLFNDVIQYYKKDVEVLYKRYGRKELVNDYYLGKPQFIAQQSRNLNFKITALLKLLLSNATNIYTKPGNSYLAVASYVNDNLNLNGLADFTAILINIISELRSVIANDEVMITGISKDGKYIYNKTLNVANKSLSTIQNREVLIELESLLEELNKSEKDNNSYRFNMAALHYISEQNANIIENYKAMSILFKDILIKFLIHISFVLDFDKEGQFQTDQSLVNYYARRIEDSITALREPLSKLYRTKTEFDYDYIIDGKTFINPYLIFVESLFINGEFKNAANLQRNLRFPNEREVYFSEGIYKKVVDTMKAALSSIRGKKDNNALSTVIGELSKHNDDIGLSSNNNYIKLGFSGSFVKYVENFINTIINGDYLESFATSERISTVNNGLDDVKDSITAEVAGKITLQQLADTCGNGFFDKSRETIDALLYPVLAAALTEKFYDKNAYSGETTLRNTEIIKELDNIYYEKCCI